MMYRWSMILFTKYLFAKKESSNRSLCVFREPGMVGFGQHAIDEGVLEQSTCKAASGFFGGSK
ncbi:hypothetical protein [Halobacillus sp. Marseille-Q1614]|uniref:hypothetical protein n=1 Tax=Halobacillus sp. Marseille-Q1614 TaxID=2709134 RepID=UPI00156DBAFE|nr:hypothetical protein [Halobacillus sp. Marseille-Q1614]